MNVKMTKKQMRFVRARADETLFGGAAGGGKSYAQLLDALLYALQYAGSKQLILRRSFPELEKSLIRVSLMLYPAKVGSYHASKHLWRLGNGSMIDFGYCDAENDVFKYQSAEYDVIRFDELTHFTESMYVYMLSRVRGANDFPKCVKSTTNPGGIGHSWVKARFITPANADELWQASGGSRLFIPSRVEDNVFLMRADPQYRKRLRNLSARDQKALLHGQWDLEEGCYFDEWNIAVHSMPAFTIPKHWVRYVAIDYGFDMFVALWIAVDEQGNAYVYREYAQGKDLGEGHNGLIISQAAQVLRDMSAQEDIEAFLAPPDLWNRRQEYGRSAADYFAQYGCVLTKSSAQRVHGWRAVKQWLHVHSDAQGNPVAKLRVFPACQQLLRSLPALQVDVRNPDDVAQQPHAFTHAPDALRYFCVYWTGQALPPRAKQVRWSADMYEDYARADEAGQEYLIAKWGNPFS